MTMGGAEYVLAIDQSTAATKGLVFTSEGELVERVTLPHQTATPAPGRVEQDAREIRDNSYRVLREVVAQAGIPATSIQYLAITNQRETVVAWDKESGEPVSPVLSWQDSRGADRCAELRTTHGAPFFRERTGLIPDAYFSASKAEDVFARARAEGRDLSRILWGTVDSWLVWNFTNRKVHATEYSNASRTLLFNINTLQWDKELLDLFDVPRGSCPEPRSSDADFGKATIPDLHDGLPIAGIMGDSQSALFAQGGFDPSVVKATYGTGSSVALNVGPSRIEPPEGVVTSIAWGLKGKPEYVWEGNIHCAGDTVQWVRNNLELFSDIGEATRLAREVPDNGGVYLVPAFSGLGAPYWENHATAVVTGLTHSARREHVIRAALESIPLQVYDLLSVMAPKAPTELAELRADGGVTANDFLMQLQSDLLQMPVRVAGIEELSALGAVYMGGISRGLWKDTGEVARLWKERNRYTPTMSSPDRAALLAGWKHAVKQALLVPERDTPNTGGSE